jgi:hypothetical protein
MTVQLRLKMAPPKPLLPRKLSVSPLATLPVRIGSYNTI